MRYAAFMILLFVTLATVQRASGQTASAPAASRAAGKFAIALSVATEEGKKNLVATVTRDDKPLEKATVVFLVRRTFGNLELGHDETLDDGTAAVPFPSSLPGGATGTLHVLAELRGPLASYGIRAEADFLGAKVTSAANPEYPRALWGPHAPWSLIAVIGVLLAGAWGAYAYVVSQLIALRKGAAA